VVGQHRSTQRLNPPAPGDEELQLRRWLRAFARRRPRWGWRRAADGLRRDGWTVNHKRVRRLWRDEGLQVPVRRRKQRLAGIGTHVGAMSPIAPDALWACDFQFDRTIGGRQVKLLNIIDEYTREALAIVVAHTIDADDVVAVLDRLAWQRGRPPAFIRFDNGKVFTGRYGPGTGQVLFDRICHDHGIRHLLTAPRSPTTTGKIERWHKTLRLEFLDGQDLHRHCRRAGAAGRLGWVGRARRST